MRCCAVHDREILRERRLIRVETLATAQRVPLVNAGRDRTGWQHRGRRTRDWQGRPGGNDGRRGAEQGREFRPKDEQHHQRERGNNAPGHPEQHLLALRQRPAGGPFRTDLGTDGRTVNGAVIRNIFGPKQGGPDERLTLVVLELRFTKQGVDGGRRTRICARGLPNSEEFGGGRCVLRRSGGLPREQNGGWLGAIIGRPGKSGIERRR